MELDIEFEAERWDGGGKDRRNAMNERCAVLSLLAALQFRTHVRTNSQGNHCLMSSFFYLSCCI